MRRRLSRLGIVLGVSLGIVAAVPALTPAALADGCSSSSIAIRADCVSVPGVVTVTSKPTEPATNGCVKDDCLRVDRSGTTLYKKPTRPDTKPPSAGKPNVTPAAKPPRGAVLGYQLTRFERETAEFYAGTYDTTLPLENGWHNGVYRNPIPAIADAPPPSIWSGLTAPAAFTSFILGTLLLVSAFSFKRLMLN